LPPYNPWVRLLAGLLAVALGLSQGAEGLSGSFPAGVPDGASLGWEKIDGEVTTTTSALAYTFYVNPMRPAIYELARYRYVKVEGANRAASTEKLVWNQYPSGGKGPQCYALESGGWRTLERGSDEYRSEMGMTVYVYGVHRRLTAER
jgi:hypothetical protein